MLKSLNKNDTLNTPFTTTKDWHLSNVLNDDLILFEHTASDGSAENAVAIEFIDYGDGNGYPFINSSCSLANEAQSADKVSYREGKKITGIFYPDVDPQNLDNTYKRLVYSQVTNMFYNNYRDPTKMWGMENIDFDKSQTKKFLRDKFVLFDVPNRVKGEKIIPNSVEMIDNSADNEYTITDDGNCNLFVGRDIFSKQQELRHFGNVFQSGSDGTCDGYFSSLNPPKDPYALSASQVGNTLDVYLNWLDDPAEGFVIERSTNGGITYGFLQYTATNVTWSHDYAVSPGNTYWYRVYAFNTFGNSNYTNTASVTIAGYSLLLSDPQDVTVSLTLDGVPTIVTNPVDQDITTQTTASFTVSASGTPALSYYWISGSTFITDTSRITGSNSASLRINDIQATDTGSYQVLVGNALGYVYSDTASLRILSP